MKKVQGVWIYETLAELIDPAHTAVLVIDVQNDFCQPKGHFGRHGRDLSMMAARLPTMQTFVERAQAFGLTIQTV